MANACDSVTAGTGKELCELMGGTGEGLGAFLTAIKSPLVSYIAFIALGGALAGLVFTLILFKIIQKNPYRKPVKD